MRKKVNRMEENQEQKTLQVDVVKRFMSDEEWREFQKEYWKNRYTQHGWNRTQTLSMEITEEEKEALKAYLLETDTSTAELKKRFPKKNPSYTAGRCALKFLYQNQELLQRI